jgi:hypothetical protein
MFYKIYDHDPGPIPQKRIKNLQRIFGNRGFVPGTDYSPKNGTEDKKNINLKVNLFLFVYFHTIYLKVWWLVLTRRS